MWLKIIILYLVVKRGPLILSSFRRNAFYDSKCEWQCPPEMPKWDWHFLTRHITWRNALQEGKGNAPIKLTLLLFTVLLKIYCTLRSTSCSMLQEIQALQWHYLTDLLRHNCMSTEWFKTSGSQLIVHIFCFLTELTVQRSQKWDKYSDISFINLYYLYFSKSLFNSGKARRRDHETGWCYRAVYENC